MIAYLELTEALKSHLLSDEDINHVVIGDISQIDIKKQTMFPLGHLLIGSAGFVRGVVNFSVTVSVMDIVDINKEDPITGQEEWRTNKEYVKNTMLAVLENLHKEITNGDLGGAAWEFVGDSTAEPFEDRFENLLTGWSMTFDVVIPNTVQNCVVPDVDYAIQCLAASDQYMSSPANQYLPVDNSLIDIEVDYSGLTNVFGALIANDSYLGSDSRFYININSGAGVEGVDVVFRDDVGGFVSLQYLYGGAPPTEGNIKVRANGGNLELLVDDVVVDTVVNTAYTSINKELFFNAHSLFGTVTPSDQDVTFNYIKINDHEWTFPEGAGATTTNSEGVITTLENGATWIEV